MKAAIVFFADFGSVRGKGLSALKLAWELDRRGELSTVLARDFDPKVPSTLRQKVKLPIRWGNKIPRALVAVERISGGNFSGRLLGEKFFDRAGGQYITNEVTILYTVPRMNAISQTAKKRGIPVVLHATECHPKWNMSMLNRLRNEMHIDPAIPSWSENGRFKSSLLAINAADILVVQSEFAKKTYVLGGVPENKIIVNPSGVDINRFKPSGRTDERIFRFLYVGNLHLAKGLGYLLEAWAELRKMCPGAKLLLCGEQKPDVVELQRRKPSLFLDVGQTGNVDPVAYYSESDAFVFPSLSEGMARVTLEAMAAGLPVITTPNSGSVIRDGNEGILIPPFDAKAIVNAMKFLYDNQKEASRMGENGRESAKLYTWDAWAGRAADILENVNSNSEH